MRIPCRIRPERSVSARLLLLLGLSLLGGRVATAQIANETDPQRTWALVVGVSSYAHAEPLLYASTDAQSLADFLRSPRGGSIPNDHIFTLLESQASRYQLLVQIESLQDTVQDGDTIYIYIAGHGFINRRGIGYFIPSDGDLQVPAATSVPFSSIKELIDLGLAHAKNRILITDICHSGRIGPQRTELAQKIQNLINAEFLKLGGDQGGSFLNLLASQPTEPSWESEELGHGVFTYALIEALNGMAAPSGQKEVNAQEVVQFVKAEVPKYTGNQQNPVSNDNFDPGLALAYLDQPGPEIFAKQSDTILLLDHTDKTPYIRAQWTDPKNESISVRQIPRDQDSVPIAELAPGSLELSLFDDQNKPATVTVNLQEGENHLDVQATMMGRLRFQPGPIRQVASLSVAPPVFPAFAQASRPAPAGPQATLLLQLPETTEVYVDDHYFGTGQGAGRLFALRALQPGPRQVRLVHSPQHEQRFRLKLFAGPQLFDPASGQIEPVPEVQSPPSAGAAPQLASAQQDDYRRFEQALWEGRLIAPSGDSAWDYYQRLQGSVPAPLGRQIRERLVTAMGDRAQQTILKYLRGGDVRWKPEVFEEGAELVDRVQQLFGAQSILAPAFFDSQERFFRGRALIERGDFAGALSELNQAIALDAEASVSYNARGLAYWKQGQLNQALPSLERAIELSPNWTYPRITRALILLEQRRYQEAEQGLQDAIALDPEDSTLHHALGQVFYLEARWAEAERSVRAAIAFNPGNAYAYQTLALLQSRTQRFDEAEQSYRLAIRLEPEEPTFRLGLAELFRQLGRVPEARGLYADLLRERADDPVVLEAFAKFQAALNQSSEAEKTFAKAIKLAPDKANLRVSHGIFLLGAQDRNAAVREFKKALDLDPANAYAHYQLAEVNFTEKKLGDSEKEAREAVRDDPRYAPPFRLLGQLAFARREHDQALAYFRQARDYSVEPHQKLQLQETIDQVESIIVDAKLEEAEREISKKDYGDAWRIYLETVKRAPDSRKLRNRVLDFLVDHRDDANPATLPEAPWTEAVKTQFWRDQAQAESLWMSGRRETAEDRFREALGKLQGEDLRRVDATSFNFENENQGVHGLVSLWGRRMIESGRYREALALMQTALDKNIFAVVPGYSPLTIDSLMTPADALEPTKFEDFEVAHHPDVRAHAIFAAAQAGLGDPAAAKRYLESLDIHGVDFLARSLVAETLLRENRLSEAIELLSGALARLDPSSTPAGLAEALALLGRIQCQAGDCQAGRATVREGLRRFPDNPVLKKALQDLG